MTAPTVDIICAARNAGAFLDDALASVQAQTHAAWRLWIRDDGSTDDTAARAAAWASRDARIRVLHTGGPSLGAARGFGWLLAHLPSSADWVACLDADDTWHIDRLAATLRAGTVVEAAATPLLIHTDCTLVDADGRSLAPSYWAAAGLRPEPLTVRRLAVQNVATGSTLLLNRALVEAIGEVPAEAMHQDWWFTLVAAVTGRVIALDQPLVQYRQHATNTAGATAGRIRGLRDAWRRTTAAGDGTDRLRDDLRRVSRQTGALLDRYGERIAASDTRALEEIRRLPDLPFMARKRALWRHRLLPEHGIVRNLGVLVRG